MFGMKEAIFYGALQTVAVWYCVDITNENK